MAGDFVLQVGLCQIHLLKGDITQIAVDAIVNAANSALAGGGGVDGAIHRTGGPVIMRELDEIRKRIGHCATGNAVVTSAGNLPARYVFHAVGPIYRDGQDNASLLSSCYRKCLDLAQEHDARSISYPSISTGVYGYPIDEAATVALEAVIGWLRKTPEPVRHVKLVQFSDPDHKVYCRQALRFEGSQS
jgi:O-acetyl-ADP-ribose deacetylase (regulator of RNase III)